MNKELSINVTKATIAYVFAIKLSDDNKMNYFLLLSPDKTIDGSFDDISGGVCCCRVRGARQTPAILSLQVSKEIVYCIIIHPLF